MGDAGEPRIDELLLPGTRELSFRELAQEGGIELEKLRAWWTATGFADTRDDDEKLFSRDDVLVVKDLAALVDDGLVTLEGVIPGAQALGQAMYRVAEWQAPIIRHRINTLRTAGTPPAVAAPDIALAIDRLESLQTHIWRRHLAAATERIMTPDEDELTATMAVGFADMVGYTRLSRGLAVNELNTLVATFEERMQSVIYGGGGWIVKGVGDEVMFAADEPAAAARIALELQSPHEYPELDAIELEFPELRVGMAYGEVLQRYGDLFGSVVNLASRLTSAARPGTILVDDGFAEAIGEEYDDLRTRSLRAYRARGFSAVHPHLLRWAK